MRGGACCYGKQVAIGYISFVDPLVHEDGELKMKFKMITRKGHKQQVGHVISS